MTDKELMQQALEALKDTHYRIIGAGLLDQDLLNRNFTVATALRERLEQAEPQVGCEGEDGLLRIHGESETCDVCKPAQQPEQEPVAWGVDWGKAGDVPCVSIIKRLADGGIEVLAVEYAPQPAQQPLTDEQIDTILQRSPIQAAYADLAAIARAIEAAHGITATREHVTDDSQCWCNPEITYTDPDTGVSVIVHKEPQ